MNPLRILLPIFLVATLAQSQIRPSSSLLQTISQLQTNFDGQWRTSKPRQSIEQDPHYDPSVSDFISEHILQFAQGLGAHLEKQPNLKSHIFSPVSLTSALALLLMGSNEKTYDEISSLFQINENAKLKARPYKVHEEYGLMMHDLTQNEIHSSRQRPQSKWKLTGPESEDIRSHNGRTQTQNEHQIRVANGIFIQRGFNLRPTYKSAAESTYQSVVQSLDFRRDNIGARNFINNWVNEKTYGKIQTIIADDIAPDTNVILASSLYFKGFWETGFLAGATHESNFYLDGKSGPQVQAKLMANGGVFPFYDAKEYDCRIIGLPYKGNLTTMYIIHPNDSTRQKLRDLQLLLTADKIELMISKMTRKTAIIAFPKMHFSNTVHLKQILIDMGLKSLFDYGTTDLSLLSSGKGPIEKLQESVIPILQPQPSQSTILRPVQEFPVSTRSEQKPYDDRIPSQMPILQPTPSNPMPIVQPVPYIVNGAEYNLRETLIFSRFGEVTNSTVENLPKRAGRRRRAVTYKVESEFQRSNTSPLRLKDLILNKRISKINPGKKLIRSRRQTVADSSELLKALDALRQNKGLANPHLYVDDIVHKIDLTVNEQGTEAAAATVSYLRRSGTDVLFRVDSPFMILIRHDTTKLPLFYGTIYDPTE